MKIKLMNDELDVRFYRKEYAKCKDRSLYESYCSISTVDETKEKAAKFTVIGEGSVREYHKDEPNRRLGRKYAFTIAVNMALPNDKKKRATCWGAYKKQCKII